jgi:hypothetical protein
VAADPAEIARTLAAGHRPANLHLLSSEDSVTPPAVAGPDGSPIVLLPDPSPVSQALRAGDGVALRFDDRPPVPGAPWLGSAWICGWAEPVPAPARRELALAMSARNPVPQLLTLGEGHTLWRVEVAEVRLEHDGDLIDIDPQDFADASPDDWYPLETDLLMDLRIHHPEVLDALLHRIRHHVPEAERITPLRMDRHGTTIDVHCGEADDRRFLVHHRPGVQAPAQVLHSLAGCACRFPETKSA